jgi:hypothetical protein
MPNYSILVVYFPEELAWVMQHNADIRERER